MAITIATYALAGTVYQPTPSSEIAWVWTSASASVLIVALEAWQVKRKGKRTYISGLMSR